MAELWLVRPGPARRVSVLGNAGQRGGLRPLVDLHRGSALTANAKAVCVRAHACVRARACVCVRLCARACVCMGLGVCAACECRGMRTGSTGIAPFDCNHARILHVAHMLHVACMLCALTIFHCPSVWPGRVHTSL